MMKSADVSTSFVSPGVVVRRGLHVLPVCVYMRMRMRMRMRMCMRMRMRMRMRIRVRVRVCDVWKMLKFLNGLFCGLLL